MKPKIKHPKIDPKKNPELLGLAHLVGEFIEYWGFKAVQGRMWCYLYLTHQPLSSIQLAQVLKISPALVTQSVQTLLRYRVVIEAEKGKNGVLRFQANPNVAEAIAGVLAGREAVLLEKIESAQTALFKKRDRVNAAQELVVDEDRLTQVGHWIALARLFLQAGVHSLESPGNPLESPEAYHSLASSLSEANSKT